MARPRTFSEDDAVAAAMEVFWAQGYRDASMPDLLDAMGLTRGSLYKAFSDKRSLFLRVLDAYETLHVSRLVERLTDPAEPDGARRILSVFERLAQSVSGGDRRGCLVCLTANGQDMTDPDIAKAIAGGLRAMRAAFATALDASEAHAALPSAHRARLTGLLLTQYVGLQTLARSGLEMKAMEEAVVAVHLVLEAVTRPVK